MRPHCFTRRSDRMWPKFDVRGFSINKTENIFNFRSGAGAEEVVVGLGGRGRGGGGGGGCCNWLLKGEKGLHAARGCQIWP